MGYKRRIVQGEVPESGAIFMSNTKTRKECLDRGLFGLPSAMSSFVSHVKKGMTLFLFEFERRLLYGVFRATCDGEINIEPKAFRSSRNHFPAQVRFTTVLDCSPLAEHEFQDAIRDNYYSGKKFHFGLNEKQVSNLMKLFRSNKRSKNRPERNIQRYDDTRTQGNARSGDLRMEIKHMRYDDKLSEGNARSGDLIKHRRCDDKPSEGNARSDDLRMEIKHRRCDDKPSDGNAIYGDHRMDIRHRLRSDSCDLRDGEVQEVVDNMNINKHIIEARQKDERGGFSTHYTTESDKFGDCGRLDTIGEHLDLKEKHIEDGYMPAINNLHGFHLDEMAVGSNGYLMDVENKDIMDYNRLQDEHKVREDIRASLNERSLNNHVFSRFNQSAYSNCDSTMSDLPDIQLIPSYFDDRSSFIPITNDCSFYPIPEKSPVRYHDEPASHSSIYPKFITRDLFSLDAGPRAHEVYPTDNDQRFCEKNENKIYSRDEGSIPYHDDPGLQSSIIPKFVSTDPTSLYAGIRVHDVGPVENDRRLCGKKRENKHTFGNIDKRASVFSRLTSTLRQEEQAVATDEKHELSSSVDEVMKMLEKVASSPIKRTGKISSAIIKQDDERTSVDSKIEDNEVQDVNLEVDADMAYEEIEGESVFQETRLVDFKRRKRLNRRINDTSRESCECMVGATSDMGLVATDQLTGMSRKRRKLVRPAFVEKALISNDVSAHENTISDVSVSTKVVETSENVEAFVKSVDDVISVPTSLENTAAFAEKILFLDDVGAHENTMSENDVSMKVVETSKKVDAFIKSTDNDSLENTPAFVQKNLITDDVSADESTVSENYSCSMKVVEATEKVAALVKSTYDVIMVPTSLASTSPFVEKILLPDDVGAQKNTVSANDNASMKVVETLKKVDVFIKSTDNDITPPTSLENTPALVQKNLIPDDVGAHENIVSEKYSGSMKVVETSNKVVDAFVKSTDDIITVSTSLENTSTFVEKVLIPDGVDAHESTVSENCSGSMKVVETSDEVVDAFVKSTDNDIKPLTSLENTLAFAQKNFIPNAYENTVSENYSGSMKVVETSDMVVDAFIKSSDIITMPTSPENPPAFVEKVLIPDDAGAHENGVSENYSSPMKVVETSDEVFDAFIKSTDDIIIKAQTFLESTPSFAEKILILDDVGAHESTVSVSESVSTKGTETSEKADALVKPTDDIITVPTSLESTPFAEKILIAVDVGARESKVSVNECNSIKEIETSEKVDAFVKSTDDIITMSTSLENSPDASNPTKSGMESSKKADDSMKSIDLNMLPTSEEGSSSEDDNSSKASLESMHISTAECKETCNEEERNAANHLVSDVFVEEIPLKENDINQKMCGWIEW